MRPIAQYLRRLLLFGLCCAVLYPVMLVSWSALLPTRYISNLKYPLGGYGHLFTRMAEAKDHPPVDIVFLGSSHAYRGFDPRIWQANGYSSYNLGSSAQTPVQSEVLMDNVLALRPRLLIMEVHPGPFHNEGVESSLDVIANRPIDVATMCMALRVGHVLTLNGLAYSGMRQLLRYDRNFKEPLRKDHDGDRYIGEGYVEHDLEHYSGSDTLFPRPAVPDPWQWRAFLRILAKAKANDLPVLLVEAPVTQAMYSRQYQGHERFADLMRKQGRYIDMNGKVALDDSTHFFTPGHLNQLGVERFDQALIDTLNGRGWLPPPPRSGAR